jgi:uroporphyrinogen-III decarboxylase
MGVPVIYFGVETAGLLTEMAATGADVIGLDWRQPLDDGWRAVGHGHAVQGNLDPITLFAPLEVLELRVKEILRAANGRPGHIFNLGHGIVPTTPVENVQAVVAWSVSSALEEVSECLNKPSCCWPMARPKPSSRFPSTCATWSAAVPCRLR